jgi:hypothetical protein
MHHTDLSYCPQPLNPPHTHTHPPTHTHCPHTPTQALSSALHTCPAEPRSEAATAGYPSTSVLQEFSEAYGYAFPSAARQHGLPPLLDLLPRLASACTTVAGPQGGVFLFPPAQGAKDLPLTAKVG